MKINQLKAGVILSYLTTIIGSLISIAYTPIMLRILGQSEYGLYTLAGSVVGYLSLLNFGLSASYVRYYSKYKVQNDTLAIEKLNGLFMTVFIVLGCIVFCAGGILASSTEVMFGHKLLPDEIRITKVLIYLLSFNMALALPFSVYSSFITANERFFFQRVLALLKAIFSPLLSLLMLFAGLRAIGMVLATVFLHIGIDAAHLLFAVKKLNMKFRFRPFNKSLFKEITTFSSFIFLNMLVDQINWNIDKFLLGIYHGSRAIAIYGLASQLNTYFQHLSITISSVFIPRVHKLVSKNERHHTSALFSKVGRIQFMLLTLVFLGFVFFGKPFLAFWGGSEYVQSYYIVLTMFISLIIPLSQNLGIEIQRAQNLHRFRSVVYIGIAMLNLIVSIPLCRAYQGLGCAIGTAISLFLGNILIMNIYYQKKCGIDIRAFWKEILTMLPALIPPVLVGIGMNYFVQINTVLQLSISMLVYTVSHVISLWCFCMNDYEKSLIKNMIRHVTRRVAHAKYNQ